MNHVIFINGAKRCGKDTVANIIFTTTPHRAFPMKAAGPLYAAIGALFSLDPDEWAHLYENAKEEPCSELWGMSPRQAMIWLSENVVKPEFGDDFFGESLGRNILKESLPNRDTVFTVSDSGFLDEAIACMNMLDESFRVHLIRIEREGTSFKGDSRGHIEPEQLGLTADQYDVIVNNSTMVNLENEVRGIMEKIGIL